MRASGQLNGRCSRITSCLSLGNNYVRGVVQCARKNLLHVGIMRYMWQMWWSCVEKLHQLWISKEGMGLVGQCNEHDWR